MLADLVKKARSYRRFREDDRIPMDTLRQLVGIVRFAPSGGNRQGLRYRLLASPEDCAKIFPILTWAAYLADWKGPKDGERPTGYIVVLTKKGDAVTPDVDVGIAGQTIQLAAAELGYGACMLGAFRRETMREALGLGEEYEIPLVIALGRPGETVIVDDMPTPDGFKYYRDPQGAHHVPKRSVSELIV